MTLEAQEPIPFWLFLLIMSPGGLMCGGILLLMWLSRPPK